MNITSEIKELAKEIRNMAHGKCLESRMRRDKFIPHASCFMCDSIVLTGIADRLDSLTALNYNEPPYECLIERLREDWHIDASWDRLRHFWHIQPTEEDMSEFRCDHIDRDTAIECVKCFTVEYAELLHKADGVYPLSQEFGQLEKAESDMIETLVDDLITLGSATHHPKPYEQWTTVLLPEIAWHRDDIWPDYLSVAHDINSEWRIYVPEATLGRGECCIRDGKCNQCGALIHEHANMYWEQVGEGMRTVKHRPVRFCPQCGRKVVYE